MFNWFLPLSLVAMEGEIVGLAFADSCDAPKLLTFEIFRLKSHFKSHLHSLSGPRHNNISLNII